MNIHIHVNSGKDPAQVHLHNHGSDPVLSQILTLLTAFRKEFQQHMSVLDDKITALTASVAAENTVIDSAVTLINGFSATLAAAIAAALAAGATPTELQSLTDLQTGVDAKATALAAAVAANTPAPPA